MISAGLKKLRELFAAMSGGEPVSDNWTSDAPLRSAIKSMKKSDISKMEGGLFLEDAREFLEALDHYNEGLSPRNQFHLVIHKDIGRGLVSQVTSNKKSAFGLGEIKGLGLERNGRVYRGEYFNDHVYSKGFIFRTNTSEGRFFCGIPDNKKPDFSQFAKKLLATPLYYPAPAWVR